MTLLYEPLHQLDVPLRESVEVDAKCVGSALSRGAREVHRQSNAHGLAQAGGKSNAGPEATVRESGPANANAWSTP